MKFGVMSYNDVISAVSSIRGGTMARISYFSELPMKSVAKKSGYTIYKITETTARFGIEYSNISSVIEARKNGFDTTKRNNNNEWIIKNRVSHNTKTGKTSVRFVPMRKGSNKRVSYVVESPFRSVVVDSIPDMFKTMVIDSYWNGNHNCVVQNININNIMMLNNKAVGGC